MVLTEIDKVRRTLIRHGFRAADKNCNEYRTYFNLKEIGRFMMVSILFESDVKHDIKRTLNWIVTVKIGPLHEQYTFKIFVYTSDTVDNMLLRIKQYIAFHQFIKA
jgi:hypothetical protein